MENLEQNQIVKAKLFHPILVTLCSMIIAPPFLYLSFMLLQDLLNGENESTIILLLILLITTGATVWGFNAVKAVLSRPKIIISSEGVYFDISQRSRSWGAIPWDDIVGLAAVQNSRVDHYLFLYLAAKSPLFDTARKDRLLGGNFLKINTRYIDKGSNIANLLAEKRGLGYSPAPFMSVYGKTED